MRDVERFAQELPSFGSAVAAPELRAEIGKRTRALQSRTGSCEPVNSLAKQKLAPVAAHDDADGAFRDAERAGRAERLSELELLLGEALGRFAVAEREVSERGFRSPREVRGRRDESPRQQRADGEEVGEPVGDLAPARLVACRARGARARR